MRRLRWHLRPALLCLPLLAGFATGAAAQNEVPYDWPLKPAGLNAGDQFRLLFITSTRRNANSSAIGDYNSFVQGRAAAGHAAIRTYSAQFRAVASTLSTHARDNTSTTGTGVPVHWLNGAKVADDYPDFYDGSWDNQAVADMRNESGAARGATSIWTGTRADGTRAGGYGPLGQRPREETRSTIAKFPVGATKSPLDDSSYGRNSHQWPLYALSPVFVVVVPEITIASVASPVTEGTAARYRVSASRAPISSLTVHLSVVDAPHGDFLTAGNEGRRTVTIAASATSAVVDVATVPDSADEPSGKVVAAVVNNARYTVGSPGSTGVTVNDDDPTVVSLARVGSGAVMEGATVEFTVTLARALTAGEIVDVPLSVSGTGVTTGDWSLARKSGASLNTGVTLAGTSTATPRVRLSGTGARVATLVLTAEANADGATEGAETVTVALGPDGAGANGFDRTTLGTNVGGGADPHASANSFDVTVDPFVLSVRVSAAAAEGDAGVTYREVMFDVSPARAQPFHFKVCLSGTAQRYLDAEDNQAGLARDYDTYEEPTAGLIQNTAVGLPKSSYPEGCTTPQTDFRSDRKYHIGVIGDAELEGDETVVVTVLRQTTGSARTPPDVEISSTAGSATYTIENDDDGVPVASFATGASSPSEAAGTHNVTVRLSPGPSAGITLGYAVTGTATSGADYTALSGSIAVSASATSVDIPVAITDDIAGETDETVVLTLNAGSGYTVGAPDEHTLTIRDDDGAPATPVVTIGAGTSPVTEGTAARFTVSAAPAPDADLDVSVSVADAPHADFVAPGDEGAGRTVTVPAGRTSASFTVATAPDGTDEPNGPVTAALASGSGYTVGSPGSAAVTVNDDDLTAVTLSTPDTTATEGAGTDTARLVLTLGRVLRSGERLAVPLQFSGGTVGTDFTLALQGSPQGVALAASTVTFTGGATPSASSATVLLSASRDSDTANETVTVSIPASSSGTAPRLAATGLGGGAAGTRTGSGQVTLVDDGVVPTLVVAVTAPDPSALTEGATATFTVSADPAPDADLQVSLTVFDGPSSDFVDDGLETRAKVTVTVPSAGSTTYTVPTRADGTDEPNAAVGLLVARGEGYVWDPRRPSATIPVLDDDPTTVTLTTPDTIAVRGDGDDSAALALTLNRGLVIDERLAVPLRFKGGVLDTDFTLALSGSPPGVSLSGSTVTFTGPDIGASAATATLLLRATARGGPADRTVTASIPGSSSGAAPRLTATGLGGGATGTRTGNGRIFLTDSARVHLSTPRLTLDEGGAAGSYTVRLDRAPAAAVTVTATSEAPSRARVHTGSGTPGSSAVLTFSPASWRRAQTVVVTPRDDADNRHESLRITHAVRGTGAYDGVTAAPVSVVVRDDEGLPLVSISGGPDVTEGGAATFTLTAGPAPAADLTVNVDVTEDGDFAAGGQTGTRTVTLGTSGTATLRIATDDDVPDEPHGSITATVTDGSGYTPHAADVSATVAVRDNDEQRVSLVRRDTGARSPPEGAAVTVAAGLSETLGPSETVTLPLTVGGTATQGTDFTITCLDVPGVTCNGLGTASASITLDGPRSSSISFRMIRVLFIEDGSTEARETVTLRLNDNTLTLDVVDAPASVALTWTRAAFDVSEGYGPILPLLRVTPAAGQDIVVPLTVTGADPHPATAGEDFVSIESFTIPAGRELSAVWFTLINDEVTEPDEAFDVAIDTDALPPFVTAGAITTARMTIRNDDAPPSTPVVTIEGGPAVTEGTAASFTVRASPAPTAPLVVHLAAQDAPNADFLAAGDEGANHSVSIDANLSSATFTLPTEDDGVDETSGPVTVSIDPRQDYTIGTPGSAQVTVNDDDGTPPPATPVAGFATAASSAPESAGTRNVAVNLSPAPQSAITLSYTVRGTATPGTDYTTLPGTVQVASGATRVDIPVTIADDSTDENAETVVLTLTDGSDYDLGATTVHTLTLNDDDDPAPTPAVSISAGPAVTEGGAATFTLTASPAPAADLTVDVDVTEDGDFAAGGQTGARTVTLDTSGTASLSVATDDDSTDEPHGSVTATVTGGSGYTVGSPSAASVTVNDNDQGVLDLPQLSLAPPSTATVTEGGTARFTVNASFAPAADVTVALDVAETPGGDFIAPSGEGRQTVILQGGRTTAHLTVATDQDSADEPRGRVSATLAEGTGYTVADDADSASVTLVDDDPTGVSITAGESSVVEDGGRTTLTVALDRALVEGESLGVPLSFGGAATQSEDYELSCPPLVDRVGCIYLNSGNAELRFVGPGSARSTTIGFEALDDAADEGDGETATIGFGRLDSTSGTNLDGGASGGAAARVEITDDDDPLPVLTIAAGASPVTEGGGASFTLSANPAPSADLQVRLDVADAPGADFVAPDDEGRRTVTILAGRTSAGVTVATAADDKDEPDGPVTVALANGPGYELGSASFARVTVRDDDVTTLPALSIDDASSGERDMMQFTIRLSAPATGRVRFDVESRESTPVSARANRDFAKHKYEDVEIRAGETRVRVGMYAVGDSHDEDPETFEVVLSNPRGAVIDDGLAVGTITNSDPLPAAFLSRFGRTVTEQALDGIAGRMAAPRTPGRQGTLAGQAIFGSDGSGAFGTGPAGSGPMGAGAAGPGLAGSGPVHGGSGLAGPGFDGPGLSGSGFGGSAGAGATALSTGGNGASASGAQGYGHYAGPSGSGGGVQGYGHYAGPSGSVGSGFGGGAQGYGQAPMQPQSSPMTLHDVLLGSSFTLTGEKDGTGGSLAFWGRASQGSFDGAERGDGTDIILDGTVTTGMLGADYARGNWLVGLALTQSLAEGGYAALAGNDIDACSEMGGEVPVLCDGAVRSGDGDVEASLTAAVPYAALQASERLKLWGAAGYGSGEVTLKTAMGERYGADTRWSMAAAGMRGNLLEVPKEGSGPALALTSDALWTRTSSERTRDFAASDSDATRLRLGLEGSWRVAMEDGAHLTPKLEVGARHDGGDAETGIGVEVGGGIAWSDPALGLSLDVSGRTLLAHENDDLKDRGVSAALAFDPDPATQRGPSFALRQELGGRAQGGLDALFAPAPLEERSGNEAASRWTAEAAWGLPAFGGRFTGSPHVGFGLATGARDYSLGWRLASHGRSASDLSFDLKAGRRENDTAAPEHTVGVELRAAW